MQIKQRLSEEVSIEAAEPIILSYTQENLDKPVLTETSSQASTGLYDALGYTTLKYSDSTSNKFWEAATEGSKLIIRFGRMGTKGQTQIKTFDSAGSALAEKEKRIKEKIAKGYHLA